MYDLQVIFEIDESEDILNTYSDIIEKAAVMTFDKYKDIKSASAELNYELSVILVGNKKIQELNKIYRNKDYITDVISFADCDSVENFIPAEDFDIVPLGDIFICIDKAHSQANEYNHSLERELSFLTIHGILHLLGYDHTTPELEKEMFSLQKSIIEKLKL